MKKILLTAALIISGIALHAQRSNVLAVFQLIEADKYEEAKDAVQAAIAHEKTRNWARTWYAKGFLCQTAYEKGKKDNNKKLYELYPDQLYVAHEAYEKALSIDRSGRLDKQVAPHYIKLANDFINQGQVHYKNKEYKEALNAYQHAIEINESKVLTVATDTSLIYNAALAAYHVKKWDEATDYLQTLNEYRHSPNVAHLLYNLSLQNSDTAAAEQALFDGIDRYEYDEDLVLVLSDHLYQTGQLKKGIAVLDSAAQNDTTKYIFPYTKGLIYQKSGKYSQAIKAYQSAIHIDPEEVNSYVNIGTCYYNIGVEIKENARKITNNRQYLRERKRSDDAFRTAVKWLEQAREKDPDNHKLTAQLNELYKVIQLGEDIEKDMP